MNHMRLVLVFSLLGILLFTHVLTAYGFPASNFSMEAGDWHDNWGINRNNYSGSNGYLPSLAFETLGENKEMAYSLGESFKVNYPVNTDRANAIFKYVQTWTEYGYDSDNVVRDGVAQEEWAWNADEMTRAFDQNTGVKAVGDCEDLAFLCGTMYVASGFDAAVVDAPEHASLLIWLPDFSNANLYWDLPNDNRDAGWIWVEATGSTNPLGWTPPDFQDGGWTAYPIGDFQFVPEMTYSQPDSSSIDIYSLLTIIVIVISIILLLARARRR